eukprot:5018899-Pleurochrysis_carterae.AAC.1
MFRSYWGRACTRLFMVGLSTFAHPTMSNASAVCTPDTCDSTAAKLATMPGLVVMLPMSGANAVSCSVTPSKLVVARGKETAPVSVGFESIGLALGA